MELKLLHLCADCMNLYGENGNMRVLSRRLAEQGATVEIDEKTLGDEIDFSKYDFIYCGSGTEARRDMVLAFLRPLADSLKAAIDAGVPMLFTGNSWEMLGNSLKTGNGEVKQGLDIFGFTAEESADTRIVGDAIFESSLFPEKLVGFINKCSDVRDVKTPLFKTLMGAGNNPDENGEGIVYKNFYGTNLTGPVLVKNPHFLRSFLKLILGEQYTEQKYEFEEKAYAVTLEELSKR